MTITEVGPPRRASRWPGVAEGRPGLAGAGRRPFLAMARVTGTEAKVREALGLPPAVEEPGPDLPPMTLEERRKVLAYLKVSRASERGA